MIVAALVLAAAQPMAAALVEKYWTVENSVISPDGFPRAAIVVVETSQRTITGPFVDGMGDELAVNDRVEFSGRSGSVPGPTLTVRQGDTVKVHVTSRLHSEQVTVHWHGLHMRKQAFQDGTLGVTQCGIVPGATQLYEFTITQMPGTHWYHSHVSSQTMDGLQGMIVVLPAEGQTDPIMAAYNYAHDEQLVVSDWAHDVAADLDTRYLTRIGTYEQKLPHEWWQTGPGTEEAVTTIFKPDYPWPSYAVLLNGRGQTDCRVVTEADCERVRAVGWPHFLNSSIPPYYGDAPPLPRIDGNLQRTYGQCMPARPPFLGACDTSVPPATVQCTAGRRIRLRLLNSGFAMALRVWIEQHTFTVVARDGQEVEPNGPHSHIVIGIGQRYDLIVDCAQTATPLRNFKIFAMVALAEAYPGANEANFEASSYAVLQYAAGATLEEPAQTLAQMWPSAYRPLPRNGPLYRTWYADWQIPSTQFLLTGIQNALRPKKTSAIASAPAAVKRIYVGMNANGNWWNNISAAAGKAGLQYEWYGFNTGDAWNALASTSLHVGAMPVVVSNVLGVPTTAHATVVKMDYDEAAPKTYEFVMINWDGQHHPMHTHGFTLQFLATGFLRDENRWKQHPGVASSSVTDLAAQHSSVLVKYSDPVADVMSVGDTFDIAPYSWTQFRLTADNPGAWLLHCHMDHHLLVGQGFMLSVEQPDGKYGYSLPKDGAMCTLLPEQTTCTSGTVSPSALAGIIVGTAVAACLLGVLIGCAYTKLVSKTPQSTTTQSVISTPVSTTSVELTSTATESAPRTAADSAP